MSTVMKEFGIRRETQGDIGVEIEVEGVRLPVMGTYWLNEVDGSLKGTESREYVLARPMNLEGVRLALNALEKAYTDNKTIVDDTVRAGVHIHINCQRLTMTQLYNFITVYMILENLLVKWCGEYREGNLFCLRTCDAEYILSTIRAAARSKVRDFKLRFRKDDIRYSSMNLKALGDYGSLEFRAMRGTRDLNLIYTWAETLYNLREFSKTYESPCAVIEDLSMSGAEEFIRKALVHNADRFMVDDFQSLIHDGMRNAQDVAYCCDWNEFEPRTKFIGGFEFPANMPDEQILEPLEDF